MAKHSPPSDYESKFAECIRMIEQAKAQGIDGIAVAHPWVLGDNYEEIIESLSRLADAGLALHIASSAG